MRRLFFPLQGTLTRVFTIVVVQLVFQLMFDFVVQYFMHLCIPNVQFLAETH